MAKSPIYVPCSQMIQETGMIYKTYYIIYILHKTGSTAPEIIIF